MEQEIKEIKEMAKRNYELISKNAKDIEDNLEKINKNKFALEILKDYKRDAKRWFIGFIVVSILLIIVCIHHFIG